MFLFGCNLTTPSQSTPDTTASLSSPSPRYFVTTPNYLGHQFQSLFILDLMTLTSKQLATGLPLDILPIGSNAAGELLILDRSRNSSLIWLNMHTRTIKHQSSLGDEGASAQWGVLLNDSRAAISFFNQNEIWFVNIETGGRMHVLDVSAYAGSDGIAEIGPMGADENFLYASVLGVDQHTFTVRDTLESGILVIDLSTTEIIQQVPLTSGNVYDRLQLTPQALILLEAGNFGQKDGRITQLTRDPDTGLVLSSETLLTEKDVDREFGDMWWDRANNRLYVIGSHTLLSPDDAELLRFDLAAEPVLESEVVLLNSAQGGNFRSVEPFIQNAQPTGLLITSRSPEYTGIFHLTLEENPQTTFIPFPVDSPPERCVLLQ